jgi:hypothetical protein
VTVEPFGETPRGEPATEAEVSARLRARLDLLRKQGRCEYRAEVGLSCWVHGIRNQAERLRIDYVASFDGGPLVGLEVKRCPAKAADLGRALVQCAQYAAGVVAPALVSRVPAAWVGQPLKACFLYVDQHGMSDFVLDHARAAPRLFGPANVGFAYISRWQGFLLQLAAERFWSERYGSGAMATNKLFRRGNGSFRPEAE